MRFKKNARKKILLARTDRIGDLILTTPAVKAVRKAYPDAYIAMITRPYTEPVLRGNPYIDDIIVYDKYGRHKSFLGALKFALYIRSRHFDRVVIFHPTNRMHITAFIANIPRRIGYDSKFGFLLTDRIKDTKYLGEKHERDYALGMLRALGIESREKELFFPIDTKDESEADTILAGSRIRNDDRFVVIHPGASCASKIWPPERFAKLADLLIQKHNVKIIAAAGTGKKDIFCIDTMKKLMANEAVFLERGISIRVFGAIIKKAVLFISNDSGPVHIASAVGTPVVDIFGRAQPGLSPLRWGPLGQGDIVVHKDMGCGKECLAHKCEKSFACIRAISVDDVYSAVLSTCLL